MIINIDELKEVTDEEVLDLFIHQVSLGLGFEQFVGYFEDKDLDKVRELWEDATVEWSEMIREREMDVSDIIY